MSSHFISNSESSEKLRKKEENKDGTDGKEKHTKKEESKEDDGIDKKDRKYYKVKWFIIILYYIYMLCQYNVIIFMDIYTWWFSYHKYNSNYRKNITIAVVWTI